MNSDFGAAKNCYVSSNFAASKKNGQVSSKFAAAVSTLENKKKMFAAFINVFSSAHSQIKTKTKISLLLPAESVCQ